MSDSSMLVASPIFLEPATAVDVSSSPVVAPSTFTTPSDDRPLTYDMPFARYARTAVADYGTGPFLRPVGSGWSSLRPEIVAAIGATDEVAWSNQADGWRRSVFVDSFLARPHGWHRLRRRTDATQASATGPGTPVSDELGDQASF
jgi:hypothetical protein